MTEHMKERTLERETIYTGRVLNLVRDRVELPNGKLAWREVAQHRPAVAILPVTDDGRLILIRQYRHPVGEVIWEVPAGLVEEGEDLEQAAQRELREEIGYRALELLRGPSFLPSPGFCDEVIHLFLAMGLVRDPLEMDDDEFIGAKLLSKAEVLEMIRDRQVTDGKTLVAVLWFLGGNWG